MSAIVNKVKDALHPSSHPHSTTTSAGPHDSNVANKLDPRVDSDLGQSLQTPPSFVTNAS